MSLNAVRPSVPRLLLIPIEPLLRRRRRVVQVEAGSGLGPQASVVVLEQEGHRPLADVLGEAVGHAAAAGRQKK